MKHCGWLAGWCLLVLLAKSLTAEEGEIDFDSQVVPILTQSGCNSGACHGAAAGRGGFRLSLYGADPVADYHAIVRDLEGRRIRPLNPELSLLVRKPTGELEHGGETVWDVDAPGRQVVLAWIAAGANRLPPKTMTHFQVTPAQKLLTDLSEIVEVQACVQFDHGSIQDVTSWTTWTTSDPDAVLFHENQVHFRRPGQHIVVARFLDRVVPLQFRVPFSSTPSEESQSITESAESRASHESEDESIDSHTDRALREMNVPPSPPAPDWVWRRRVSLDLTGRLPSPTFDRQSSTPLTESDRIRYVDELMSSDSFVDLWTLRLARQLRLHRLPNEREGVDAYGRWLRQTIANDIGWDDLATELLTATGDAFQIGPANFGRMVADPRGHAELVGEFFFGVQLGCANCHNHPLDQWTQDDFHGLAAIFAKLERGREVRLSRRGAVTNLRTGEPAVPKIPGERYLTPSGPHGDDRVTLADWIVSEPNRRFARATVNRLWQAMMGRGLVEPVSDMRQTNPASHPELLAWLADDFVQHGYRIRHTLRQIALSRTYARSGETLVGNALDDRFYSHAYARPLLPEVWADLIADVTGVAHEWDEGTTAHDLTNDDDAETNAVTSSEGQTVRAVRLLDPLTPARTLDLLGRCSRAAGCSDLALGSTGLSAQLHLINGDVINARLSHPRGRLTQLLTAKRSNDEIVEDFYLRALGRPPTDDEQEHWNSSFESDSQTTEDRVRVLEDFVWSLLHSHQVRTNH